MSRVSFATLATTSILTLLLIVFLFADSVRDTSAGFIASNVGNVTTVFHDPETQWMILLCLAINFVALILFRSRFGSFFVGQLFPSSYVSIATLNHLCFSANFWLTSAMVINVAIYVIDYSVSIPALIFLGGAVFNQTIGIWTNFPSGIQHPTSRKCTVCVLVLLLTITSLWQTKIGHFTEYRGILRWSGFWTTPNIYGLLMGTGIVLALGLMAQGRLFRFQGEKVQTDTWKSKPESNKYGLNFLFLLAVILMGRGLLHSFSRGAWVGTFCGGTYLLWKCTNPEILAIRGKMSTCQNSASGQFHSYCLGIQDEKLPSGLRLARLRTNWLLIFSVLIAALLLSVWHFRHTDWHLVHRALSAFNKADFSWRNRVTSWEGALQIAAEHPWFGVGWNQPVSLYEHFYLSPKLIESAAIEMNDYFILGATLGIPALICFGMYLWFSLTKNLGIRNLNTEFTELNWLQTTCRAGVIVLLIGFWFDGGLFIMPTAATFWILLELGTAQLPQKAADDTNR